MAKNDYSGYIVPLAVVAGGYLILSNLGLFGSKDNDSNNDQIDQSTADSINNSLADAAAAGDFATMTNAQAAGAAAAIYNAGVSSPVDQDTIQRSLIQANTLTDLLNIAKAFGTKQASASTWNTCSLFGFNCQAFDLSAWVAGTLDSSHLSSVNTYLSDQGINYSF